EFVHEKDRERMLGYHARRRVEPESVPRNYEFSLVDRQGTVRDVIITISLIPGTKKSVASFADISDRRRSEERLRESEDRYRTIFETTGTATIIVEEDTTVTLVNTEFEKLSGAPKDYWEGKRKWTEFVHEKDRDRMLGFHRSRRINPESAPRNYEFSLVNMQGDVREVIITISMIPGTKRSVASFVDITKRKQAEEALKKNERDLKDKTHELEELNAALRVLLKRREEDKLELENNVVSNLKKLVIPYIEKLKKGRIDRNDLVSLNVIESNLKDIASPFASKLSSEHLSLTPKELQVADLIKEGKTTKEIAEFMSLSPATVEIHRYHIREKLGLSRKKTNLRTYLSSLK
ncbi:MAG TPA: PAS domain S-box protein, partial [Syntrophorhabdaceae bacterium]|nr:PAS domain S-box protein [Syntrophorhabdaceae bacterium]